MGSSHTDAASIYHERTKHHLDRYARSPGTMDWATQPIPFRSYDGCKRVPLPFLDTDPDIPHPGLYDRHHASYRPPGLRTIAGMLELSMGLSAWKSAGGARWALRMNPSSGNLHPTECYLWTADAGRLPGGMYHYHSLIHELECRMAPKQGKWPSLESYFGTAGFLIGLTSIFWRESWKYGERAYRYCSLDTGHALAAISMAAGLFGWRVTALGEAAEEDIAVVLGLDRTTWHPQEAEHPDLLCWVHDARQRIRSRRVPPMLLETARQSGLAGTPEALSPRRRAWPIIEETAAELAKPATAAGDFQAPDTPHAFRQKSTWSAPAIIRRRRSATDFDPSGVLDRDRFLDILDKVLPRAGQPPFDTIDWTPRVHLLLFVHAVNGLERGLYFFSRHTDALSDIQDEASPRFSWTPIEKDLPLFLLETGDVRADAIRVSCHQEIAGFSAFSLGMIAGFRHTIADAPYAYRQLFWECGIIGQVLYLEAEAQGVRGTGIGCFFDDAVHRIMALEDDRYQSMYHFTVGTPVTDTRMETLPAYSHLDRNR